MTVVEDKDLPERMKEHSKAAHEIAQQSCEQTWNIAIKVSELIAKQISGNDALSYMGTIAQDFVGRWITLMDDIRLKDDAGILREDMIKELLNGILATIGATANYEEDKPLPNGIKKLK